MALFLLTKKRTIFISIRCKYLTIIVNLLTLNKKSLKLKLFYLIIAIGFTHLLFAQNKLSGKVIDEKTKAPLAFVNIIIVNANVGTTTDIDGKFTINSLSPILTLKLSYVGYALKEVNVKGKKSVVIGLTQTSYQLTEFKVLPGINPAERIIRATIKNSKIHNPEKSLNFKYQSYNKIYFTGEIDSSILNNPNKINALDTGDQQAIKWLDKHHLFMMESVSERKYKQPDKSFEKVIASRVSGLKNPTFSLLATQMQSFSFYNPTINVLDKTYLNPISKNSINKYLFLIEDTIFNHADTVYVISFRPRKGKNFDALKGLLYINTDEFALQNVIAEPVNQDESINIKIQQQYKKVEGKWFPAQLNSTMIFNNMQVNNFKIMGISRSYITHIEINPELKNKEFSYVATEIENDATKKDDAFWNKYRVDTLSAKEKNTYHVIDSLGKAEHFDKKINGLTALMTGKLKWGFVSLDLNKFLAYNDYEGIRLGAGLHTNRKIAKWFNIGGYGAYAFKDKTAKYGGDANFLINYRNDISLNFSYKKDVEEPGVVNFYDYKVPLLSTQNNRVLYLSRMNNIEKKEVYLKFRTLRYLKVYLFANQENVSVTNNYYFNKIIDNTTSIKDRNYLFNEVGVEFRYAFKEKVMQTLSMKYATPSKYPVIYAKIEHGVKNFNGDYAYTRFTLRTQKRFYIKNLGHPSFFVETGYIDGNVPEHKLNSSLGSFSTNTFLIATENAFETMLPYEFFSNKYLFVHFQHSFGSLLLKIKKFEPEFVVTSSFGIGTLNNANMHQGVAFKTMKKGYYESGFLINNILKLNFTTFGVGIFYRYGPYQLIKKSDNITLKMSLGYAF